MLREFLKKAYRSFSPNPSNAPHPEFGGSGITEECYEWIRANVMRGGPVLEFGAGLVSTAKLSKDYELTSVEHDEKYIGAFDSNYIYAPLSKVYGWYEIEKINHLKNQIFELAIIDGPPGSGNRFGILLHMDMLKNCKKILVDDTNRPSERLLLELLSKGLKRSYKEYVHFAVIENT